MRPGVDRHHRPAEEPADGIRAHAAADRSGPAGQMSRRARSSATRANGPCDRCAPPLGGRAQRGLREPAAVPLARRRERVGAARHRRSPATTPRHVAERRVLASRGRAQAPTRSGRLDAVKRTMAVILAGGEGERLSILSRSAPSRPSRSVASTGSSTSRCRTASTPTSTTWWSDPVQPPLAQRPHRRRPPVGPRPQPGRRQAPPAVHLPRTRRQVVSRDRGCGPPKHEHRRARPLTRSSCWPATTTARWTTSRSWPPIVARGGRDDRRPSGALAEASRMDILAWTSTTASPSGRRSSSSPKSDLASMGVYVFSKRALRRWLTEERVDFGPTSSPRCSSRCPGIRLSLLGLLAGRRDDPVVLGGQLALLGTGPSSTSTTPRDDPYPVGGARPAKSGQRPRSTGA